MSTIVAIGATHQSASLDLLERLSFDEARLAKYLGDLVSRDHISEAAILSTCNRVEIVVAAEKFHGGYRDVRDFISDVTFMLPEEFADSLVVTHDADAVRHLFSVAAGLESVVVGEHEILGQVRSAWAAAQEHGTTGTSLNLLFRHAVEVGKRARTETNIARHVTSVSHASVIMADSHLGALRDRDAVVFGAGSMARGVVDFLGQRGVAEITVLNRTPKHAAALGAAVSRTGDLGERLDALVSTDVAFFATSSPEPILTAAELGEVMERRGGTPLLLVDIAMPRDVDPAAADVEGVTLLDMDGLARFVEDGLRKRRREVPSVKLLIEEQLDRFLTDSSAREVAPLVVALRSRAEAIVHEERNRYASKLVGLDDAQRAAVDALLNSTLAKLLHEPTQALKSAAGTTRGDRLVTSVRELFDLD
ncbi:MAG: glutamyl-tRNA reductase [Actinobacteria bacterium]|nr:glutamyl-tRNA reductase [Actinomycetota bacterium]